MFIRRATASPVEDLTATDFQIAEDGVSQKIESFEHIVVQPASTGRTCRSGIAERARTQLAADPHRRVFVVFLDTGGVHVEGSY